jgi:hypothetical protein
MIDTFRRSLQTGLKFCRVLSKVMQEPRKRGGPSNTQPLTVLAGKLGNALQMIAEPLPVLLARIRCRMGVEHGSLPRAMMWPLVKLTSSRICVSTSHPAFNTAGVMHFVQMSRSLKVFLSMPRGSPQTLFLATATERGYVK